MSYSDPTYVVFDGDEDKWAYAYMLGWKNNDRVDFNFNNAHDLDTMTARAQGEDYVKRNLKTRMKKSKSVLVLVGEKTKNLHKFVRWEMELALELGLPIIVANLNDKKNVDAERCPPIIRNECVVHIPFKMKIIKHALDDWPMSFAGFSNEDKEAGARFYKAQTYQSLGLSD
jgi:MTH538 TIR-like domain (DUF1863)